MEYQAWYRNYSIKKDAWSVDEKKRQLWRTECSLAGKVPCGETYPPGFKSSTRCWCLHFYFWFILWLINAILSVVGDIFVDSEPPVVTLSILRIFVSVCVSTVFRKEKTTRVHSFTLIFVDSGIPRGCVFGVCGLRIQHSSVEDASCSRTYTSLSLLERWSSWWSFFNKMVWSLPY